MKSLRPYRKKGSPIIIWQQMGQDGGNLGPLGFTSIIGTYKRSSHAHGRRLHPPPPPLVIVVPLG